MDRPRNEEETEVEIVIETEAREADREIVIEIATGLVAREDPLRDLLVRTL